MASNLDHVRASIEDAFASAWRGSATGTPLVDQADHAAGDDSVHVDGLTALPTVGEWFQVTTDRTWYRITSVSALVGTDADIEYEPVAVEAWAENATIEFYETPVQWQNVDFAAPEGYAWARPVIIGGAGSMRTAGSGVTGNAVVGLLKVSIFDVPGKGLGSLYDMADVVREAFSREYVGTSPRAFFFAPSWPRDASDATWGSVVVDCPFEVREA